MLRRPAVLLLLLVLAYSTGAEVRFGAKQALNLSRFTGPDPPFPEKRRLLSGWDAGIWAAFPFGSRLALQTELLSATRGDRVVDGDVTYRTIYTHLDIPLLLKWDTGRWSLAKLLLPASGDVLDVRIYLGPRISSVLSGLATVEDGGSNNTSTLWPGIDYSPGDVGLVLGVEWQLTVLHHVIQADLRYAFGFVSVDEPDRRHHHSAVSLFLGYGVSFEAEERGRR